MPNWEESSDQHDSNAHSSNYNNHEDLSDDGDEASQDGEDDDEPDPFINLLDKNEPTGSSAPSTNQPSAQNELKRKKGNKRARHSLVVPLFCEPSVEGVEPCPDPNEVSRVQTLAQMIIGWRGYRPLQIQFILNSNVY